MTVERPQLGHIGNLIKTHYDELVAEPLPPRLAALVERLNGQPPAAQPEDSAELDQTSDPTGNPTALQADDLG
jgi:hypothetical protein